MLLALQWGSWRHWRGGGLCPQRGAPPAVQTQPGAGQGRGHSPGTCAGRHAATRHELTPVQTACAARPGWSRHLCRHTHVCTHTCRHAHTCAHARSCQPGAGDAAGAPLPIPTPAGWQPPPCTHVSPRPDPAATGASPGLGVELAAGRALAVLAEPWWDRGLLGTRTGTWSQHLGAGAALHPLPA